MVPETDFLPLSCHRVMVVMVVESLSGSVSWPDSEGLCLHSRTVLCTVNLPHTRPRPLSMCSCCAGLPHFATCIAPRHDVADPVPIANGRRGCPSRSVCPGPSKSF